MGPKSIKIIYWILLVFICLFMVADGIGGITMAQQGVDVMNHLGYPPYLMPLFGGLKLLGVIALLQTKYLRIKEWVFAGMAFTFIGAAVSRMAVKDPLDDIIQPVVALVIMFILYLFWKKYEQVKKLTVKS